MSIQVTEDTIGIWYSTIRANDGDGDLLAHLRHLQDGKIELTLRFRKYDKEDPDNDPFSDKDEKEWYVFVTDQPKVVAIQQVRATARRTGNEVYELLMQDKNVEQFMDELLKHPCVHAKQVSLN